MAAQAGAWFFLLRHSRTTDHRLCEGALHKLHGTDYRFRLIPTSSIPTTLVQACSMFLVMPVATSPPSVLQPISGNGPTNATLHLDGLLGSNPFFLHANSSLSYGDSRLNPAIGRLIVSHLLTSRPFVIWSERKVLPNPLIENATSPKEPEPEQRFRLQWLIMPWIIHT